MTSAASSYPLDPATADRVDPLAPLVAATIRRDSAATRALLTALGPPVLAVLEGIFGRGHPDIEDIAQESLVAIVKALPDFRFESSVIHYARRIALRRATVAIRHRRAERRSDGATVLRNNVGEVTESPSPGPDATAIARRRVLLFRKLLAEVSEEQAETLALQVVFGYSIEEIAQATGVPSNTVRSRLRATKEVLRGRIATDERLAELNVGVEP